MAVAVTRRVVLGAAVAIVASPASGRARFAWPGGKRGAVSFTYDDALDSQIELAAPELEAHDLRGTFFITPLNMEGETRRWAALAERGHEIVNHSVTHPCDLRRWSPHAYSNREILPLERLLKQMDGPKRSRLFAYPCDATDLGPGSPNQQAHRFAEVLRNAGIEAARTSEGEPNNPARVIGTRYRLQALSVGWDALTLGHVTAYLDLAARRGHWAILVFHDIVSGVPTAGKVSSGLHRGIVEAVKAGSLWCAPMGEVFEYCRAA